MKNYLIVGASKGIGLKTTQLLGTESNIFAVSRNPSEDLVAPHITHIELDAVTGELGTLDVLPKELHGLVYCPGSINLKSFQRLSPDDFLHDFQQNVLGAIRLIQFCLPRLKNAGGSSIVMFSTVAASTGMAFHSSVAVSKAGIEGLGKSLAFELAGSLIRVNVIAPSLTNTPLAASLINTPEKLEASNKRHPLQRIGQPADIAEMTVFLLGDKSGWITGQVLHIDGGMGALK